MRSPEERELDLKREELAALEADLVELELQLSTLDADLAAFRGEYLRVVGRRYAELDDLNARIAEAQAIRRPEDNAVQEVASRARHPQWTGQIRPFVDTANPAISGVPRRELSFTSRRPVLARLSGPWCASCGGRT